MVERDIRKLYFPAPRTVALDGAAVATVRRLLGVTQTQLAELAAAETGQAVGTLQTLVSRIEQSGRLAEADSARVKSGTALALLKVLDELTQTGEPSPARRAAATWVEYLHAGVHFDEDWQRERSIRSALESTEDKRRQLQADLADVEQHHELLLEEHAQVVKSANTSVSNLNAILRVARARIKENVPSLAEVIDRAHESRTRGRGPK